MCLGGNFTHIRAGALLNGIGKMAVPDRIVQKPGPLTLEEWEIMLRHPTCAYEFLSPAHIFYPRWTSHTAATKSGMGRAILEVSEAGKSRSPPASSPSRTSQPRERVFRRDT